MKKIETIFKRDPSNLKLVLPEPTDAGVGSERPDWVFSGEGVATLKVDGTCCLWHNDRLYRRHALKAERPMPAGWLHWSLDPIAVSGHGWLPVGESPADDYHREALALPGFRGINGRTYELIGPKINSNPYKLKHHLLWLHGSIIDEAPEREFEAIRDWFKKYVVEGIVWYLNPPGALWGGKDTLMAKIKRKDFGLPWPEKK